MLKSISLLTVLGVLGVGSLVVASLPPEDSAKSCSGGGGACAKDGGGCPATAAAVKQTSNKACASGKSEECATAPCAATACGTTACGTAACAKTACGAAACGTAPCGASACAATACATAAGKDCQDCPVTAAMKALPQLIFAVGEEKTACPKAAAELAQKSSAPIHYLVADKSYSKECEANVALAEATEQFVAAFAEPKQCKESGKVTVAGKQLCCPDVAAQTAAVAKAAMDKVEITYLVGEKECHCAVEAEKLSKESGDPTVYVVAGESTGCSVTARLNLARAKYKAAVLAVLQAGTQADQQLTSKDS